MPLISIGMPIYNGEKFLQAALDSLLAQTFGDFELIISDNASTDGTEEICHAYTAQDRRIRYFRNEKNLGAARNFNRVLELSSGEYFKWHSADDLCAPDLMEKCKEILDKHPEVVLCHAKAKIIDAFGEVIRQYDDDLDLRFPLVRDRFRQLILKLGLCNAQYGLMRLRILRQTSLYRNFEASDVVFLTELVLYGRFLQIPEYLFFRRFHPQASSHNTSTEQQQEFYDPGTKGRIFLREWRHLFEHLRSIKRAPLAFTDKIYLLVEVLRLARWKQKQLIEEVANATKILAQRFALYSREKFRKPLIYLGAKA